MVSAYKYKKGELEMNKIKKRKKGGFTLIEMVVVIAIVVIIAAIAIPQALKAINKSRASTDIANARTYAGEIMTKVADGTIKFEAKAVTKLTKDDPTGFNIDPANPKLVDGDFYYEFKKDDKGNETVEISVGKSGSLVVIYPTIDSKSEYYNYVNTKTGTTTAAPTT